MPSSSIPAILHYYSHFLLSTLLVLFLSYEYPLSSFSTPEENKLLPANHKYVTCIISCTTRQNTIKYVFCLWMLRMIICSLPTELEKDIRVTLSFVHMSVIHFISMHFPKNYVHEIDFKLVNELIMALPSLINLSWCFEEYFLFYDLWFAKWKL